MEASGSSLKDPHRLCLARPAPDQNLRPDQDLRPDQSLHQDQNQDQNQDQDHPGIPGHPEQPHTENNDSNHKGDPGPSQVQEVQEEVHDGDPSLSPIQVLELVSIDGAHLPDQDQDHNLSQDLMTAASRPVGDGAAAEEEEKKEKEERHREEPAPPDAPAGAAPPLTLEPPSEPLLPAPSCGPDLSEAGDMTCCDLLSLRSDSLSLTSEAAASRRSEEDDTRSVAASSVMSLFHRVQLDPLEKDWLRSSALGNSELQHQLLAQEPGLVFKKDFITTALHWAAKQGRQDTVDLMLRYGADVNIRSGYTALHLASIHGHQQLVHSLIHCHNAKTNIRDYHGKMAAHYWSGCSEVFLQADALPGGRLLRGRRSQRSLLPSLLLTRSHSQGHFNLELRKLPQSSSQQALDLYL